MRDRIRVLVLGTGQMGCGIARMVLDKQGLALVGAYGRRTARAGTDLGRAIGLDRELGMPISADLDSAIAQTRPTSPSRQPARDSPTRCRRSQPLHATAFTSSPSPRS